MNGPLEWVAAIGTIIAAALIAADLGRRVTGWGFVLFCVVASMWIYSGVTSPEGMPIAIQNGLLLIVNIYGVWQFLISRKKKREIDKAEEIAEQAEGEVAKEAAA
jgi:uncharacterized membrane protein YphA (DoxX/SURF4 family)